jgi:anti-sigma regulatory factor (Ser/Thr protein kinase)
MNNKERGQTIRRQILRDVKHHPEGITRHISKMFSITPQAVYRHIKSLEDRNYLSSTGRGKGKRYFLGDIRDHSQYFVFSDGLAEDQIWRNHFANLLEGIRENVIEICHYGFTEIVNNAIDHSGGTGVYISVERTEQFLTIYVVDDGEGIFRKIARLCDLIDERQAILELSKGKLTTDPDSHTGEGIFFTSRVFDLFDIDSKGLNFTHASDRHFDYLLDSSIPDEQLGTMVYMKIRRTSEGQLQEVFDSFTAGPDEFLFNKTVIPVRLAQYGNETLISRSQAKRMLVRVERFENVIFDFDEVESIGQAFADEIFRVYSQKHPEITLVPVKMNTRVSKMVNKALAAARK